MEDLEGFTPEERAAIEQADLYGKMADSLRAQAMESRIKRERDGAKPAGEPTP